jgi:hypothetical protein
VGRRRGWCDVFEALCGGNVLELLEVLSGRRLVFRIRLRINWRAGVSGKNVADEVVSIHKTQKWSSLSRDRSREVREGGTRRRREERRWREGGERGMKRKRDFFHLGPVRCRPGPR